ncbi:unnamed protein product [Urochloa humidicola]
MINRRFVNVVTENYMSGMYSLHRLDVSKHLFYRSAAEADAVVVARKKNGAGPAAIPRLERLPPPCISFQPTPMPISNDKPDLPFFALASPRRSEGRIITCTEEGDSLVYDADSNSNQIMPGIPGFKGIDSTIISTTPPAILTSPRKRTSMSCTRASTSSDLAPRTCWALAAANSGIGSLFHHS